MIYIPDAFLSHSGCSDPTLRSPLGILHYPVSTLPSLLSNGAGAHRTVLTCVCFPQMSFRSRNWVLGSGRETLYSTVVQNSVGSDGGSHQSDLYNKFNIKKPACTVCQKLSIVTVYLKITIFFSM